MHDNRLLPILVKVNEAVLVDNDNERESLLYPFQAMEFRHRLNLTLVGCKDANGLLGAPKLVVNDYKMPFIHNSRKLFFKNRMPTDKEMDLMTPIMLISPVEHELEVDSYLALAHRRKAKKCNSKILIEEWQNRLALVLGNVIKKTLDASARMVVITLDRNRSAMKRYYKSRFPFLH